MKVRILIEVILSMLLILGGIVYFRGGVHRNQNGVTLRFDSVKYYKDINGHLNAKIKSQTVDISKVKGIVDSLSIVLKTKPRNIRNLEVYTLKIDTVITEKVIVHNTRDSVLVEKNDKYISLKAIIKDSLGVFHLSHRDTIYRTEIVKPFLFRKAETTIYLRNASPYSKIISGSSFTIKNKKPFLTVGPSFGVDVLSGRPIIGISVQIPVLTLYKK